MRIELSQFVAVLGAASIPSVATAQTSAVDSEIVADQAEQPGFLNEIVVTARRTAEPIQTTPVAVTALDNEALQQQQIQTIADLTRTTPNLNISTGGPGPSSVVIVAIRGQSQGQPSTSADPSVATYIDGVYYARPTGGDLDLFDVAQAEILRGPQGTLFGRNTTGGAINIVTNDPVGYFEGTVRAGYGNLDSHRLEAMVNIPLKGDELAVRFVGRYLDNDGYGRFVNVGGRSSGDIESSYFARAKVKWAPMSLPLTLVVAADYSRFRSSGQPTTLLGINEDLDLGGGFSPGVALGLAGIDPADFISTEQNFRQSFGYNDTGFGLDIPYDDNDVKGISANLTVDLGGVEVKSITAYRENFTQNVLDLDSLPVNLVSFYSLYDQRQFSQELQLSGSTGKLDWIGGAIYFEESSTEFANSKSFGFLDPTAPPGRGTSGDTDNRSIGVFGQLNYNFTDRLRATAGLRYTWDRRSIVRHPLLNIQTGACAIPAADRDVPGGPCDQTQSADFDYPAWVFSLDYEVANDLFVYAKTSGAAMAGGWNLRGNFAPFFSPEKVRDVEVGFKADLLDGRLRTNVAAFHMWQNGAQRVVARFDPVFQSSTQYVVNAGKSRLYGLEFEGTLVPWEGMTIEGDFAYLNASYVDGSFLEDQIIANTGPVPAGCVAGTPGNIVCTADRSGEDIPYAPKYNWSIGATQEVPTSFGSLSFHADYSYVSSKAIYSATAADQQPQAIKDQYARATELGRIEGYGLLNGVIKASIGENVELSVWGRNLTDKDYVSNVGNYYLAFGPVIGVTAPPRTYGATFAVSW